MFVPLLALVLAARPASSPDTLQVTPLSAVPTLDGRADEREYGRPMLHLTTAAGDVPIWIGHRDGWVYVAASMPDTSFYWGDDFVISIDADGSGGTSPRAGDRQWYLRRVLDSSTVVTAVEGRWNAPGQPFPMLGTTRHHDDWEVASASDASRWSVELRFRAALLSSTPLPRIAFRTYNSAPQGWWSMPAPPADVPAQRVERTPDLWIPLLTVIAP